MSPLLPAKLLDESLRGYGLNICRNEVELDLAERRLRDIGFEIEKRDRVTTYKFMDGQYTVLADPREKRRITFLVYMQIHDVRK